MRPTRRSAAWRALTLGVALGCAGLAPGAAAGGLGDELRKVLDRAPRGERELGLAAERDAKGGPLTLDQAVARVRERHPKADIVSAETRRTERGTLHVIKLLKADGKLKVIRIDAATGADAR